MSRGEVGTAVWGRCRRFADKGAVEGICSLGVCLEVGFVVRMHTYHNNLGYRQVIL